LRAQRNWLNVERIDQELQWTLYFDPIMDSCLVGSAIDDLVLVAECSSSSEW